MEQSAQEAFVSLLMLHGAVIVHGTYILYRPCIQASVDAKFFPSGSRRGCSYIYSSIIRFNLNFSAAVETADKNEIKLRISPYIVRNR